MNNVEKVTSLVLRTTQAGEEILVFQHPAAGLQLPAGTVEDGESPEAAAFREVLEETGLSDIQLVKKLGVEEMHLPSNTCILRQASMLYPQPSYEPAGNQSIGRGWRVESGETRSGFTLVTYDEWNLNQTPPELLWQLEGWLPSDLLSTEIRRHFYLFHCQAQTPAGWDQLADMGYTFHVHWLPLQPPPGLIKEQVHWLDHLRYA
jgi:8-oxo-dGTP pyrophosphatase MutT (NUDIX family)